jgi:hypothetical protein
LLLTTREQAADVGSVRRFIFLPFVLVLVLGCGHSKSSEFRFRIYDPLGNVKGQVTESGVLRSSARSVRLGDGAASPEGSASFYFRLTDEGEAEFHRLTRALVRRGARLHRPQRFVIEMNGTVLSDSTIDYRLFPDGFDGKTGLEFAGLPPATAQRLAHQMRAATTRP